MTILTDQQLNTNNLNAHSLKDANMENYLFVANNSIHQKNIISIVRCYRKKIPNTSFLVIQNSIMSDYMINDHVSTMIVISFLKINMKLNVQKKPFLIKDSGNISAINQPYHISRIIFGITLCVNVRRKYYRIIRFILSN